MLGQEFSCRERCSAVCPLPAETRGAVGAVLSLQQVISHEETQKWLLGFTVQPGNSWVSLAPCISFFLIDFLSPFVNLNLLQGQTSPCFHLTVTGAINSATDCSRGMLKVSGCFCPEHVLWAWCRSPRGWRWDAGDVPRSTCCLSGRGSVALALCSGFPSPPYPHCVVQAKHRHPGMGPGALRGSAAAEAALELLGWEHTKSLLVCTGASFPAFQQVFGKELAGSCVPAAPKRAWALLSCWARWWRIAS